MIVTREQHVEYSERIKYLYLLKHGFQDGQWRLKNSNAS